MRGVGVGGKFLVRVAVGWGLGGVGVHVGGGGWGGMRAPGPGVHVGGGGWGGVGCGRLGRECMWARRGAGGFSRILLSRIQLSLGW